MAKRTFNLKKIQTSPGKDRVTLEECSLSNFAYTVGVIQNWLSESEDDIVIEISTKRLSNG